MTDIKPIAPLDTARQTVVDMQTPRQVISGLATDPALLAAVQGGIQALLSKSFVGSRTAWVTLLTPIVAAVVAHFGLQLDDATVGYIATALTVVAAWVMRYFTSTPIGSVLPQAKPGAPG